MKDHPIYSLHVRFLEMLTYPECFVRDYDRERLCKQNADVANLRPALSSNLIYSTHVSNRIACNRSICLVMSRIVVDEDRVTFS